MTRRKGVRNRRYQAPGHRAVNGPAVDSTTSEDAAMKTTSIHFTQVLLIRTRDETFYIHKDVLTSHSSYFDEAFNGQCLEGQNQTITLDDIETQDFDNYAQVLYQSTFDPDLKLRQRHPVTVHDDLYPLVSLLGLWQLADRFLHRNILAIVEEALSGHWTKMSVDGWLQSYPTLSQDAVLGRIRKLEDAYELCKEKSLPFKQEIIAACANCPPQAFAYCIGDISGEFQVEVARCFALRYADPAVTKKRSREELLRSPETSKKQKTTWDSESESDTESDTEFDIESDSEFDSESDIESDTESDTDD